MNDDSSAQRFATRVIHGGQRPDPLTGAVMPPIYATSTYVQSSPGVHQGYDYSRSRNPTRDALQAAVANLEGAGAGFAFASGMAASSTVLELLDAGSHIVAMHDLYGGSYRLLENVRKRSAGHSVSFVDLTETAALEAAIRPTTRLVWVETPTNPLLRVADIAALAEVAHAAGALLVVDNTFASPYLQQPLLLGADVVVHSTTKYLGGHSDVVGGALVARDPELAERLAFHQNAMGAVSGPFDAWLTLRGIKTLGVRMDRHCSNARAVAEALRAHPGVTEVLWPGFFDHDGHSVAVKQMRDFGGMVSFRVAGGEQKALDVCARTKVFILGESLGGVESLIEHPGRMTHASVAGSELEVPGDLVRLSVGIESVDDLVSDVLQALE